MDGKETFITEVPNSEQGEIRGYHVYGDAFVKQLDELKPVPINDEFLKCFKEYRENNEGRPFYAFIGNGHVVECFPETRECSIDGGNGVTLDWRHELINVVKSICGLQFTRYYVLGKYEE